MDEKLMQFVDHARGKGMDLGTIRQVLLSAGWKEKDIAEVFCARELELPIPRPAHGVAAGGVVAGGRGPRRAGGVPRKARDAFLHLLVFGSLFVWSTSVIMLLFTYINFAFPDPAWRTGHTQLLELLSIMRFELATVIVSFPIFLLVWNYLLREVERNPETGKGVLRRWLGYLSLFVGAITLSGDAMILIYFLLEGQLTIRFVLKAVVLFLIAGGLVGYLAFTLRSEARTQTETDR